MHARRAQLYNEAWQVLDVTYNSVQALKGYRDPTKDGPNGALSWAKEWMRDNRTEMRVRAFEGYPIYRVRF